MSLRKAALVAGFGLLVMVIAGPFTELFVFPKLVVPGNVAATVHNLEAGKALFLAGLLAYLVIFVCDVIVAWALYVLLAPVHRALSLLAAWFRVVYATISLVALLNLATVFRLLHAPGRGAELAAAQLHPQVDLLLRSFHYEWGMGLILFGGYLVLLGYLVYRSGYIPRILGVLLAIAGVGWLADSLSPYLYPNADLRLLMVTFLGEIVFMAWLLARGWKIEELAAA